MLSVFPQTEAISNLKNSYEQVISRLRQGPVMLLQRSKPTAVLVSMEEWQRSAQRLAELEEREMIRGRVLRARANPQADISLDSFLTMLTDQDGTHAA